MPRSRWARRSARGIEKKVCVKAVFFYKKDRPTDDPLGCLRQPHGTHPPFPSPFRQPRFLFYAPGGQFFSNFLMPTLGVAGVPTPCSHPAVHYAPACFARAMQLQHGASLRSVCPFKTMGSSFKPWFPYFRRQSPVHQHCAHIRPYIMGSLRSCNAMPMQCNALQPRFARWGILCLKISL